MRLIILAAGTGSRLQPYTNNKPKCLVEVSNKPLIDYQIEAAKAFGISDIVVVTGQFDDLIKGYPVQRVQNPRYFETNMVYSLYCAKDFLSGDIMLSYGDIIYTPEIFEKLLNAQHDINVVVDLAWESYWAQRFENPLDDAESLRISHDGILEEIGQKISSTQEIQAQYIGLMKFSSKGIHSLLSKMEKIRGVNKAEFDQMYMTDLLTKMIQSDYKLYTVPIQRGWFEIDNPRDLQVAKSHLEKEFDIV